MSIVLGSNIAANQAQRRLAESTRGLQQTFERLSSGLRINRAGDDAAGLAISESLKADTRVFSQAVRNLNDGLGLLSVADSALENLSNIVIRLRELSEQASNGVYGNAQRAALDKEAQKLSEEYFRIVQTTAFNGRSLFSGDFGNLTLQGGFGTAGSITSGLGGAVGSGTFGTVLTLAFGPTPGAETLAFGDLNNDGILDLVTGGQEAAAKFIVRLGLGDGTFGSSMTSTVGGDNLSGLSLADFNNDGILDIVTASGTGVLDAYTTVRLGTGTGTFQPSMSYSLGATSQAMAVQTGDINNDGNIDILSLSQSSSNPDVNVQLGRGNGTFGPVQSYFAGSGLGRNLNVQDMNGDGFLDTTVVLDGAVQYALGRGDGTLGAFTFLNSTAMTANYDASFGDVNNDGIGDFVVSGLQGGAARISVQLGRANGTFSAATTYTMAGGAAYGIALGDLNGDGNLDIATSGDGNASASVRLGNGDGSFASAVSYSGAVTFYDVALADLNGDGVLDLGVAGDNGSAPQTWIRLGETTTGVGPLLDFSLRTRADALHSIAVFSSKLSQLSTQRGVVGAYQSRVFAAVNTLHTSTENYQAAASRITDADTAEEAANLVRGRIMQQAAASVLAQANTQPRVALDLLQVSSAGFR